jgi:hypothetical protein
MRIGAAIAETAAAEAALAQRLREVGERHRDEHDVFHLSGTLAEVSGGHVESLAAAAERYGVELPGPPAPAGKRGGSLLDDLRELHLLAAEASIDWTILGQGAQALRDQELLDIVSHCHADNLRVLKWTTTRIKLAAPQILMG